MYFIPKNYNLNTLAESVVIQICFTANTITLFFEKVGRIDISGSFAFLHKGERFYYEEIFPIQSDYGFLKLLEKKVTRVSVNEKRDVLTLEFEDNTTLELVGNETYETYTLNINGEEVIV